MLIHYTLQHIISSNSLLNIPSHTPTIILSSTTVSTRMFQLFVLMTPYHVLPHLILRLTGSAVVRDIAPDTQNYEVIQQP